MIMELTLNTAALTIIFSIGLIPVVASTMRLCEIVMSGNAMQTGMAWQQADTSWYVSPASLHLPKGFLFHSLLLPFWP
jgi:uncharacterized protein YceK